MYDVCMHVFFVIVMVTLSLAAPVVAQEATPSVTIRPARQNIFRESLLKKSVTPGLITLEEAKIRLTNLLDTSLRFITSIEMNITGEGNIDGLNAFVLERIATQKEWISEAQDTVQEAATLDELRTIRDELNTQWTTRKRVAGIYAELKRLRQFSQLYNRVLLFSQDVESKVSSDNASLLEMKQNLDEADSILEAAKISFLDLDEATLGNREATPQARLRLRNAVSFLRKAVVNGKRALSSISTTR